jgi:hypothetical protein
MEQERGGAQEGGRIGGELGLPLSPQISSPVCRPAYGRASLGSLRAENETGKQLAYGFDLQGRPVWRQSSLLSLLSPRQVMLMPLILVSQTCDLLCRTRSSPSAKVGTSFLPITVGLRVR